MAPSSTSGVPLISQGSSSQPAFGTAVVAGGGTGDTSFTAYSVITGGTTSTGALQNVSGVGTSGQVLTSAGAGALPAWGNRGLVLIETQTASASSSLTFTTGITSTYNNYLLIVSSLLTSGAASYQVQISTNGGSTYITTGYLVGNNNSLYNSATITNANATTGIFLSSASGGSVYFNHAIYLYNFTSGAGAVSAFGTGGRWSSALSTGNIESSGGVYSTAATTVNAFRLLPSAGTFTSGTASLYGIQG